jgi:hypothetical protein
MWQVYTRPTSASDFFLYIFVNLESCLLVFGNWFGITEMTTDRKVKSRKKYTKTAKELTVKSKKNPILGKSLSFLYQALKKNHNSKFLTYNK